MIFEKKIFQFIFLLLFSCTHIVTLNLKSHKFAQKSKKIVWFQIPGLDIEHFIFLKINKKFKNDKPEFEKFQCIGKAWSYNFLKLRPAPEESLFSQLTGAKDITGKCSDLRHDPLWKILSEFRFKTKILENAELKKFSLKKYSECAGWESFLGETVLWETDFLKIESQFKIILGNFFKRKEKTNFNSERFFFLSGSYRK